MSRRLAHNLMISNGGLGTRAKRINGLECPECPHPQD